MSEVNLDIQEINLDGDLNNTSKEISLDTAASSVDLKEANFGSGIELLMNEKVKNNSKSPSSNSLKDLEKELDNFDNKPVPSEDKEVKYELKDSFTQKPKIEKVYNIYFKLEKIYILFILNTNKQTIRYFNLIGQKCFQISKLLFKILLLKTRMKMNTKERTYKQS